MQYRLTLTDDQIRALSTLGWGKRRLGPGIEGEFCIILEHFELKVTGHLNHITVTNTHVKFVLVPGWMLTIWYNAGICN